MKHLDCLYRTKLNRWPGAALALLLLLGAAACGRVTDTDEVLRADEPFIVEGSGQESADVAEADGESAILAQFDMANGSVLRFIDESVDGVAGGVGLLEVTPAGAEQLLPTLDQEARPTALEVFRAVAPPGAAAPARLVADHRRVAAARSDVALQPRDLTLPTLAAQGTTKGVVNNSSWCDATATQTDLKRFHKVFKNSVHQAFGYEFHGHGADYQFGTKYGVTGTASRRALYVCSFYDGPFVADLKTSIWRNGGLFGGWDLLPGTSYTVPKGARMYYRSDDNPFDFPRKYRVKVVPQQHWAFYNIEGSWGED